MSQAHAVDVLVVIADALVARECQQFGPTDVDSQSNKNQSD